MKKRNKVLTTVLICMALFLITFMACAELSLDEVLLQINVSAQADFGTFKAQMTLSYDISENRVDYFHTSLKMAPSDIFMVFEVAAISQAPVDKVVEVYKVQKKKGWGVMAKELGIKPGSKEFKLLKSKADDFYGKLKPKEDNSSSGKKNGKKK